MPTRFAKQLGQIYRGARCIGLSEDRARGLVTRIAADTLPPMRRTVLGGLLNQSQASTTAGIARRVGKPRTSVDRRLQELVALGIAIVVGGEGGEDKGWHWQLSDTVERDALAALVPGNVSRPPQSASNAPLTAVPAGPTPGQDSTLTENPPSDDVSGQPPVTQKTPAFRPRIVPQLPPRAGTAEREAQ